MKIFDLLATCVRNLVRRKVRTAMTIIGVIIGTCAIISTISLGIAANENSKEFISSLGDLSIIQVWQGGRDSQLDDAAIKSFYKIDGVEAATPFSNLDIWDGAIYAGKNDRYMMQRIWSLTGVYSESLEGLGYTLAEGTSIKPEAKTIQVIAGSHYAYAFQDTKRKGRDNQIYPWSEDGEEIPDPFFNILDQKELKLVLKYGEEKELVYTLEVVGVLDQGSGDDYNVRENLYMDIRDMQRITEEFRKISKDRNREPFSYNQVVVKVNDINKASEVEQELIKKGYGTFSQEADRQNALKQTRQLQLILGSLGGISLFVAAISIANTMIMSVYERTKEIGIMKVLGCFVSNIRAMFLVEASMIGFGGGIFGVLLSYLISFLLNKFGGSLGSVMGGNPYGGGIPEGSPMSIIPPWLVLLGLTFATLVGILSGIYPAYRAVRISALEAIKQD